MLHSYVTDMAARVTPNTQIPINDNVIYGARGGGGGQWSHDPTQRL